MATSYNGWTASRYPTLIGVRSFVAAGVSFPAGARGGDVAKIFAYIVQQFDARVQNVRVGWCWGYYYRLTTNASTLSCHASGTAIDINAPLHPYGKRGTFSAAQVRTIRAILAEVGGVVRWGGDFNTPDDMHFEIRSGVTSSQVRAAAARLGSVSATTTRTGDLLSRLRTLKEDDGGHQVYVVQRLLQIADDGDFGPSTKQEVVAYQKSKNLTADGIVGEKTWRMLTTKSTSGTLKTLDLGASSHQVYVVQRVLEIADDGDYGKNTKEAVMNFQKRKGLSADGIVGGRTWDALLTGSA